MVGNAKDEDLAKSNAQDIARFGVGLAISKLADPVVEQAAVAQHAEEDRLQEPAVARTQLAALRMAFDKRLGVIMPLRPSTQCGDSGLADMKVACGHVARLGLLPPRCKGREEVPR